MSASVQVSPSGQVVLDGSSTAKKINSLLNTSKTRFEGLQLLDLFLSQCSDEEFLNHCVNWMQNCCKADGLAKNTNYPIHLLCKLLKTSSNYPELRKPVSFFITTRYFDFFFKHILNSEVGWICTEICLSLYRGACGSFQEALEKHLKCEVESSVRIPLTVARCFALLPACGGAGSDGLNYKRNWKNQFCKFLGTCHSFLNDLFTEVEDFQLQENGALEHRLEANGSERNIELLAILFQNYCTVLGCMLLNQYPAPKSVPADLVFRLVCRGLAVNPVALGKRSQTTDLLSLRKVLPDVHCALLSLLKAVVVTCKNQLLPFSNLICKLIKQSLQWTESDGSGKPFGRVRISTYEALCDWLVVSRSGSCVELISEVVVSNAASDIKSKEGIVVLKEAKPQNQSKRKEQKTGVVDSMANVELCHAALRALEFLLKFAGVLLKTELHKFLQELIIQLLMGVQRKSPPDVVASFAAPSCRVALYSVLLELVHQPCLNWPPPTSFALKLFSTGLNDSSPEVSSFCSAALNYVNIIIHPQYDNGGFPLREGRDIPGSPGEVRWREEPMEVVSEKVEPEISRVSSHILAETNEADPSKKASDPIEGSDISSDEDSKNTISFLECMTESVRETIREETEEKEKEEEGERKEEAVLRDAPAAVDDSHSRADAENVARQKTPSPNREKQEIISFLNLRQTPESGEMRKPSGQDSGNSKSVTPESANEGDHPRGRYFLRSKTKGSSEEPEEAPKRTSSVESLKGTPAKSASKAMPSAKRPRTRALSKLDGNDDEEDIRAAFDDSFVD